VLHLAEDLDLSAFAGGRVSWAKMVDQRISLGGDATARVVARRVPGDSHVRRLVILDRGLDAADPAIRAGLESAPTELRALTGLEGSPERQIRSCGAIKRGRRASYLDVTSRGC
jgi:hypothetical protein